MMPPSQEQDANATPPEGALPVLPLPETVHVPKAAPPEVLASLRAAVAAAREGALPADRRFDATPGQEGPRLRILPRDAAPPPLRVCPSGALKFAATPPRGELTLAQPQLDTGVRPPPERRARRAGDPILPCRRVTRWR